MIPKAPIDQILESDPMQQPEQFHLDHILVRLHSPIVMRGTLIIGAAALATLLFSTTSSFAEETIPPECAVLISHIVEKTGAIFDRVSEGAEHVFLKHPAAGSFVVDCEDEAPYGVFASWPSAYPQNSFYTLVALTASIKTGDSPATIERAARKCHDAALRDPSSEKATVMNKLTQVDCQAFTRDGGSTDVTVTKRVP